MALKRLEQLKKNVLNAIRSVESSRRRTYTRHTFFVGAQRQLHLIRRRPRMVVSPRHHRQMTVEGGEKDEILQAGHLLGIQLLCMTVDRLYTMRTLRHNKTPIGIDGEESSQTRTISEAP